MPRSPEDVLSVVLNELLGVAQQSRPTQEVDAGEVADFDIPSGGGGSDVPSSGTPGNFAGQGTVTWDQFKASAAKAGINPEDTKILFAIAKGESGLRMNAVGDTSLQTAKWGPSVGVLQIRTLKNQTGTGGARDIQALSSLDKQLQTARDLIAGRRKRGQRGFEDWTVYNKGIHRQYL